MFALLVGLAANTLWKMHESGELLDQYNSRRKANITMLAFSVVAVAALGGFELSHIRNLSNRRHYGRRRFHDEKEEVTDGLDSTSIYAAPKTMDDWQGRRTRTPKSRHAPPKEMIGLWMGMLRICCIVMPLVYIGLLARSLLKRVEMAEFAWLLPALFGGLVIISIVAAVGLFGKKTWGVGLGYFLAICNLMVFPFGTAMGLFLLLGLVGASAEFAAPEREKRRKARRKAQAALV
ncbi:hypothetical protein [Pontiella desulfatans]|uniref:hypothetical protein n=1 Tax=Pontiella desulfatans TaxID=2750659 RepID=UPI00109D0F26|nr:hypothetical protein [Pontiella desulfatans]